MWFLPTRGRPHALDALLNSPGGLPPHDQIMMILSADDPQLSTYDAWPFQRRVIDAKTLGDKTRWITQEFMHEKFYGALSDDVEPQTKNWWKKLEDAAGDRWIAVGHTNPRGAIFMGAAAWCMGGDLIRAIGYLTPPGFVHNFMDNVMDQIAQDFDLVRPLPDVRFEHRHPFFDKSVKTDATYDDAQKYFREDEARFREWLNGADRVAVSERLAALFNVGLTAMDMSKIKLNICTPFHDYQIDWAFDRSMRELIKMCQAYKIEVRLNQVGGGSHIGKARERLIHNALRSDATHIMCVDSDMGFKARDVLNLIAADLDFAAAVGVKKMDGPPVFCCNFMPGNIQFHERTKFSRVKDVGFGLVVIKRHVFEQMADRYPELKYKNDDGSIETAFFMDMIDNDRMRLSEDLSFCRRWTDMDGEIYVDHGVELIHAGRKEFSGRLMDIFKPAEVKLQAAE